MQRAGMSGVTANRLLSPTSLSARYSRALSTALADKGDARPLVNSLHEPEPFAPPLLEHKDNAFDPARVSPEHWSKEQWSTERVRSAQSNHVVASWGATKAIADLPIMERSEGIYLYDRDGKQYMDWTSQAVCTNFGYDVPPAVIAAVTEQLTRLPMVYSGLGISEIRCRTAELLSQILPGDINGFLFPSGGAEANEAAVRIARRYTGKHKILTHFRSYHGGTTTTLAATGDFRRGFAESGVSGFVKMMNPTPNKFSWGANEAEIVETSLAALEEQARGRPHTSAAPRVLSLTRLPSTPPWNDAQIEMEGPDSIAAVLIESIVGSGGVLIHPTGYVQGVRALCDKYDILYIADEVMVGFGRTVRQASPLPARLLPAHCTIVTTRRGVRPRGRRASSGALSTTLESFPIL